MRKPSRKRAVVVRQGFFQSVAHAAEGDEQESDEQEVVALHVTSCFSMHCRCMSA